MIGTITQGLQPERIKIQTADGISRTP